MNLLVLSDLHVEFAPFNPPADITEQADVIILAGDIHNGALAARWARRTFSSKPIIWVAGNHEFYNGHWDDSLNSMRQMARNLDIHFLEDEEVEINGVRFLGTSLWTDFAYFGQEYVAAAMAKAERYMLDYQRIEGCTPAATVERHIRSRTWLEARLAQASAPRSTVVVTHHAPRRESVEERYRSNLCTAAFASHLPAELVQKAGLWIHGHMHASKRYQLGNTWVVCNPRGYPRGRMSTDFENPNFNPGLLLEQPDDGWQPKGQNGTDAVLAAGPAEVPSEIKRRLEANQSAARPIVRRVFRTEQEYIALWERAYRAVDTAINMNNNDLADLVQSALDNGGTIPHETREAFLKKGHSAWVLDREQKLITKIYEQDI